jgi:hypothetical protein
LANIEPVDLHFVEEGTVTSGAEWYASIRADITDATNPDGRLRPSRGWPYERGNTD